MKLIENINNNMDNLLKNNEFIKATERIHNWYIENDTKRTLKNTIKIINKKILKRPK